MAPLSESRLLTFLGLAVANIFIGMGLNAMVRPRSGLDIFEFPLPSASPEWEKLVDNLMIIYGVRDVFMGLAMLVVHRCGSRKALGWVMLAAGAVAGVDGWVSIQQIGRGQWNHWGYAPVLIVVGGLITGIAD